MGSNGPQARPRQLGLQTQSPPATTTLPTLDSGSLLACLAYAQFRHVDLTGISAEESQGSLGSGGEASVFETRASTDTVLAFRKHTPERRGILGSIFDRLSSKSVLTNKSAYRQIANEILALGHPNLRSHRHIVQLVAISWEIRENERDKIEIWPVLIFEKAKYKDLEAFIRDPERQLKEGPLSPEKRLTICADIADAMAAVHQNGIKSARTSRYLLRLQL